MIISSGMSHRPCRFAQAPVVARLLQTETGMARTKPARTGENHQSSRGAANRNKPDHAKPSRVPGACRPSASRRLVCLSPRCWACHFTFRPRRMPTTKRVRSMARMGAINAEKSDFQEDAQA